VSNIAVAARSAQRRRAKGAIRESVMQLLFCSAGLSTADSASLRAVVSAELQTKMSDWQCRSNTTLAVEEIEIWRATSDGYSFVISFSKV
jgi:hypothetical protein